MSFNSPRVYMHFERHLRRVVFGTAREAANLGKKLHLKVWRIDGEPQLSLFFKLIQNSPTCGRVARVGAIGGPFGQQDIMI